MRAVHLLRLVLFAGLLLIIPAISSAQVSVGVSITVGPPALPVYVQPPCPAAGYIWTPGYWAYGPDGYYWVPGTWVLAPQPGFLWTPGYWGWGGGVFLWHAGYWGPHIGFYGGINYGFGYTGVGFAGGYWNHGVFMYNRSVTNVNTTVVTNVYNKTVINNNTTVNHVSYNGGNGGVTAKPTAAELSAEHEHHLEPTSAQAQHEHSASTNHNLLASVNHGRPSVAATTKPGEFTGKGVVSAKNASGNRPENTNHAKSDRPPSSNSNKTATNTHSDRPPSFNKTNKNGTLNSKNGTGNGSKDEYRPSKNSSTTNTPKPKVQNNSRPPAHPQNPPHEERERKPGR